MQIKQNKMKKIPLNKINPRLISKFAHREKSDCTVRALSNVLQIPYEEAHQFIKKHCKRKNGVGVRTFELLNLFNKNKGVFSKQFNVGIWEEKRFKTVNQLINNKPNGRFYVLVRAHATAVINGQVADMVSKNWHIEHCWEIITRS